MTYVSSSGFLRAALLEYVVVCVEEINRDFPLAHIELAGDLNQLPDQDLVEQTRLTQIVHQPTRGDILDRIFVSDANIVDLMERHRVNNHLFADDEQLYISAPVTEIQLDHFAVPL